LNERTNLRFVLNDHDGCHGRSCQHIADKSPKACAVSKCLQCQTPIANWLNAMATNPDDWPKRTRAFRTQRAMPRERRSGLRSSSEIDNRYRGSKINTKLQCRTLNDRLGITPFNNLDTICLISQSVNSGPTDCWPSPSGLVTTLLPAERYDRAIHTTKQIPRHSPSQVTPQRKGQ
jgi:hypothetical protein